MSGCGQSCEVAEKAIQQSADSLAEVRKQIEEAIRDKERIKDGLERIVRSKDDRITDLRGQLEKQADLKKKADAKVEELHMKMINLSSQHQQLMANQTEIFTQVIKEKDEKQANLIMALADKFNAVIEKVTASNERIVNRLMDRMEKQDEKFDMLIERMEQRLDRDDSIRNYSGFELYKLVEEQKLELEDKYTVQNLHVINDTNLYRATFAYIGAILDNTPLINSLV